VFFAAKNSTKTTLIWFDSLGFTLSARLRRPASTPPPSLRLLRSLAAIPHPLQNGLIQSDSLGFNPLERPSPRDQSAQPSVAACIIFPFASLAFLARKNSTKTTWIWFDSLGFTLRSRLRRPASNSPPSLRLLCFFAAIPHPIQNGLIRFDSL
jgi:hypothetical protein